MIRVVLPAHLRKVARAEREVHLEIPPPVTQRAVLDALGDRALDVELDLAVDPRQRPQVGRQHDPDHGSVCTSTDTTAGRCCTMGAQRSPASAEA